MTRRSGTCSGEGLSSSDRRIDNLVPATGATAGNGATVGIQTFSDAGDASAGTTDAQVVTDAVDGLLRAHPPSKVSARNFLEAQFDAGLAWVHNPVGAGGLGFAPELQSIVNSRIASAGGPTGAILNPIGYGMCGPAIAAHGNSEQLKLLRPLFSSEHIWCQMFSEPGAGSDVASLATRAVRDGDEWIVNGQKVWTTLAHESQWGLLIARTDPDVPKHSGMTAFLVDMSLDGIDVRPLRQMTGDAEFNEVYFTDTRIPDTMRLDEVGRGWPVAITTLMNERVSIGAGPVNTAESPVEHLLAVWRNMDNADPVMRDRVTRIWIQAEVNRLTNARASANQEAGTPGPEGSVGKLAMAENAQELYNAVMDMYGAKGMLFSDYSMSRKLITLFSADMTRNFLRSRATSIEGGSSEVLRNVLGERVLGLPGDVRVDRDKPWSEIPRS